MHKRTIKQLKVVVWEEGERVYKDEGIGEKVKKNLQNFLRFKT